MDAPTPPQPPKGFEPDEPLFVPDFATLPAPPTPETFMRGLEGWAALIDEDGLEPAPRQFTKMPMVKGVCRNENLLVYPVSHSCRIVAWGL